MRRFDDEDLTGAEFRECDLSRARMVGVVMQDAEIDGLVTNLVVNGVEVMPYVEAELDQLLREERFVDLYPVVRQSMRISKDSYSIKKVEAFYGREHAGYAYGLEPLADLLRQRGKVRDARPLAEEAVANLWRNGHAKLPSVLALRAAIIQAGGTGEPLFAGLALVVMAAATWWVGTSATARGIVVHAVPTMVIRWDEVREIEVSAFPIVGNAGMRGAMAIFWDAGAES